MYSWLNIITQSQQTLIVDAGSPLNVKCKTEKCITFYLNDVSRNTFIFCIITALSGSNHELLCHLVCPLYLPELLAFLNAERRWAPPVCVRNTAQAQAQILTSFVHISCFSPCLCRKPPFPGVNFFHYKGNWKGDGDYFFLPFSQWWVHAFEEELCHPGISTLCMHHLCSLRRPLHHSSLRELGGERASCSEREK